MALTSTEQLFIERPPISRNVCKKIWLQCYRLYNFPSFRSSYWRCSVWKGFLRILAKFTGKHLWQSLFFNKVAGWGDCLWSFSCFLLKFLVYFISTEKWNEKRGNTLMELKYLLFAWVSICFTSKILREIWQMGLWSENVFNENLM